MSDPVERFAFERLPNIRPKEYDARVVHSEWVAEGTLKIAFEPVGAAMFPFHPGQYVSIVLPEDTEKGLKKDMRPYSMWNHPDEFEYVVTIAKMVDDGRCTSWLATLKEGDSLRILGPLGAFYLRRPLHENLTFVSTGTGMVPLRAMIKDLISTGEIHDRDVTLLFGVRSQEDLFGTAELERWTKEFPRFRFVPTLSRPKEGWMGAVGRVTAHLEEWDFPVDNMQVYLCGNGAMIKDAIEIMEAKGLGKRTRRIVFEKYFD
jgi:NAD(P)H-flavin reductase